MQEIDIFGFNRMVEYDFMQKSYSSVRAINHIGFDLLLRTYVARNIHKYLRVNMTNYQSIVQSLKGSSD